MTETEIAAAELFDKASADIAGSIAELIAAASERGEIAGLHSIAGEIMVTLLASTWKLAIFNAEGDRAVAAQQYGKMLDAHREMVREACAQH